MICFPIDWMRRKISKLGMSLCLGQQHRERASTVKELADTQATKKGISALGRVFGLILARSSHHGEGLTSIQGCVLAQPHICRCGRVCLDAWQSWMGG